jgi:uncharacterized protein (DUF608 family)
VISKGFAEVTKMRCRFALVSGSLGLLAAVWGAEYSATPALNPLRSAIPLGGLGCGTIELGGDGGWHEWQIFNNFATPAAVPEALLAARVKLGGQTLARVLHLHPPHQLPGVDSLVYRGEYPFAWLTYTLDERFPVQIRLEAFTPFIPHDAEASAFPAAVLRLAVINQGNDPAQAQLAFFMPPAMQAAGAGPKVAIDALSTSHLAGARLATVPGSPPRVDKPVRVLMLTDNPDAPRVSEALKPITGLSLTVVRPEEGRLALPGASAAELREKVDVLWLAELGRARERLTAQQMQLIRDAVQQGMGFLHSGGWDSCYGHSDDRWAKLTGTPIEEILPVRFLDRYDAVDQFRRGKLVTSVPELAAARLAQFPGVGGYNEVAGVKPAATVVLATEDGRPLLVTGRFGQGRTAAYLSTPFGGWPQSWGGWGDFYGALLAYLAGVGFSPSDGTPPSDRAAGSLFVGNLNPHAQIRTWSTLPAAWQAFAATGSLGEQGGGNKVAVLDSVQVAPGEQAASVFLLAWYFPNHFNGAGQRDGKHYGRRFRDAADVAAKLAAQLPDLETRTRQFHDALYRSSLPYWLADALNAQLTTFAKASEWDEEGHFAIWEGMNCCCGLHTIDVSYYGSWPLTLMFPELQKGMLRLTAQFQRQDGRIPHLFAGGFTSVDSYGRIDLPLQFILPLYREYLYTGDEKLLRDLWPAAKKAADSIYALDKNGDALPEHTYPGDQTYDGWAIAGESAYIGSLWLAALRALEEMAKVMGDGPAAARYRHTFAQARETYERLLWNGKYYRLWQDPVSGAKDEGLMLDALNGQWYADLLGLGPLLPPDHVHSHLRLCLQYNRLPVQRGMAYMVGDQGYCYVNCSWPGEQPKIGGQPGSPWTGTEYAFASLCIYEGLVEEGLQVVRDVYERYREAGMTWNHLECGGHYFRPLDVWTVLLALEGLVWKAPQGELWVAPAPRQEDLRAPLILPQGWGILSWRSHRARSPLEIRWVGAQVPVRHLKYPLPQPRPSP